jgi:hypothetical protein
MDQVTTTCDQCGARKPEVGHWFQVSTDFPVAQLVLEAENSVDAGGSGRHLCGTQCLMKEVAEWAKRNKAEVPGQFVRAEQTPWPFTLAGIALG